MISVKEAADILKVSTKKVYLWISEGYIPCQRLGNHYYLERDVVLAKLAELGGTEFNPAQDNDPLINMMLQLGGIHYDVPADSKQSALYNALSQIKAIDAKAMDPIFRMFLSREELASTGIGDGIAIPHSRSPLVGFTSEPLLSLSYLAAPIEFDALDGVPVNILFMLISPNMQTHLRILAKLSFLLQDTDCRGLILDKAPAERIISSVAEAEQRFGVRR
ncbi:MAG TPA: PTS sugar transporter subunit IIA [Candidatus Cloacimonadota bacterium]|nr:PTS sugar transporter subunit IIA [Candidatus Cloacimonadota bacterium]